jgi:hypothetical protein
LVRIHQRASNNSIIYGHPCGWPFLFSLIFTLSYPGFSKNVRLSLFKLFSWN